MILSGDSCRREIIAAILGAGRVESPDHPAISEDQWHSLSGQVIFRVWIEIPANTQPEQAEKVVMRPRVVPNRPCMCNFFSDDDENYQEN
jgi:hypothetical protein